MSAPVFSFGVPVRVYDPRACHDLPTCPAHPTTLVAVNACHRQFSAWVPWPLQLKPQLVLRCLHPPTHIPHMS